MNKDREFITMEDEKYYIDEMTQDQRAMLGLIRNAEAKIAVAQGDLVILQEGREGIAIKLKESLEKNDPEGEPIQ